MSVELPISWKEDGEAVVHFTFEFNDSIIEIHQPEETWHSGKHSIALYYPIENLIANYRNIFNVYMRVSGGSATVDVGDCLAGIMGQSMGAGEAWDGEIKVEDHIKRVDIGGAIRMAEVDEHIGWIIDETLKKTYRDTVHGRVAIGAFAMPVERQVTMKIKGNMVIEMIDHATGEVVETHEENMVTNAINHILGLNPMGVFYNVSGQYDTHLVF